MRLLLFDIDGTLIRGNQAGRLAMGATLERMFGTKGSLDSYPMGGKTDTRIVADVLEEAGVDSEEIRRKLPDTFLMMADMARDIYPYRAITPCPGVELLLEELQKHENVLVGLLTGNAQPTAPLKLSAGGIDPSQFVVGAYGSDDPDRNRLPDIALRRACELTGDTITGDNAVIIGDTPADVQCARAGRATAIAVASGWHTAETLAQHNPDHLFEDLSDTKTVLSVLLDELGVRDEQRRQNSCCRNQATN